MTEPLDRPWRRVSHAFPSRRWLTALALLGVLIGVVACAGSAHENPDVEASAAHHREVAEGHLAVAGGVEAGRPFDVETHALAPERGLPAMTRVGEAWLLGREQIAIRHRAHARQHLEAAAALEAFEFGECIGVPARERGTCPLLHDVEKIEAVPDGVRLFLSPEAEMEHVLAHIRCHHAFGRARAFVDMSGCPLYIPHIDIRASGTRTIGLFGRDHSATELLQRRVLGHQAASSRVRPAADEAQ